MNQRGYYSRKVRAGKRTYFFDVRATRNGDFFMTITESKKKHNDSGFENHKVFIYKEDFHKFVHALKEGLEHIHTNLSEMDIQDINTPKHSIEDELKDDDSSPFELSDDSNDAIETKTKDNPKSW